MQILRAEAKTARKTGEKKQKNKKQKKQKNNGRELSMAAFHWLHIKFHTTPGFIETPRLPCQRLFSFYIPSNRIID